MDGYVDVRSFYKHHLGFSAEKKKMDSLKKKTEILIYFNNMQRILVAKDKYFAAL